MTEPTDRRRVPVLLLSHRLGGDTHAPLVARFPDLRIVVLSESGDVPEDARDATVLYRAGMPFDALSTVLAQLPRLAWIHTASAGFNWVLIPEVTARPIRLTRTTQVLNVPIAEYAVGATLALLKHFPAYLESQRQRGWDRVLDARGLDSATVGVVGAGAIGRAAAVRYRAFGARLIGMKRDPSALPEFDVMLPRERLDELLEASDVALVACPLTPETRHLLGRDQFARMRPHAVLANVARGEALVEDDLIEALRARTFAGAALDVFTVEPLPSESPLWSLGNVVSTPHVSYVDPDTLVRGIDEFAANLERFLDGRPLDHEIKSRELGY